MSDLQPSYDAKELRVLADAVDSFNALVENLSEIEAWPRDWQLHIDSEIEPGYLGHIGYDEGGAITFQPALKHGTEKPT